MVAFHVTLNALHTKLVNMSLRVTALEEDKEQRTTMAMNSHAQQSQTVETMMDEIRIARPAREGAESTMTAVQKGAMETHLIVQPNDKWGEGARLG